MKKSIPLALFASVVVLLTACGDDPANPVSPGAATSTSPSASVTSTPPPLAATATSTNATSSPAADGTVDPLGFGGVEPVSVKAQPGEFSGQALLKDVRIGVHSEQGGWDRIVFEFAGGSLPPATIAYAASASQCGSGASLALKGGAVLTVRFSQAAAHDQSAQPTFVPKVVPGPGTTILEAKASRDFEGVVAWAAGIKGQQRFKVTTLQSPPRLVIDVKQ